MLGPLGHQPALLVLRERGITLRRAARDLGVNESQLGRVLRGWLAPTAKIRNRLPAYLDLPETAVAAGTGPSETPGWTG